MKKYILTVWFLLSAAAACGDDQAKILAQVNDKKITLRDFNTQLSEVSPKLRPFIKAQKRRYLQGIIEEELLVQEAQKLKLQTDAQILRQIERAKRRLMVQKLLQTVVKDKIQVGDKEAQDYYLNNTALYQLRERARFSIILVKDRALAEEILKKSRAGTDFASLAMAHSVDSTKMRGGNLGFMEKGQMGAGFDQAAFALKPGEVSGLLETPNGFQIIKMTEYQPAKSRSFEEVKESIRRTLLANKEKQAVGDYIAKLRASSKVQVQEALLKEVR